MVYNEIIGFPLITYFLVMLLLGTSLVKYNGQGFSSVPEKPCNFKVRPVAGISLNVLCCTVHAPRTVQHKRSYRSDICFILNLTSWVSFGRGCRTVGGLLQSSSMVKRSPFERENMKDAPREKRDAVQNGKQSSHKEEEKKNKEIRDRKKKRHNLTEHSYGNINRKGEPGTQKCGTSNSAIFCFSFVLTFFFIMAPSSSSSLKYFIWSLLPLFGAYLLYPYMMCSEQQPQSRQVLPTNVKPLHYNLWLKPHLDTFVFEGQVKVK